MPKSLKTVKNDKLYEEIKSILQQARRSAYRAVNFAMVVAYWEIGKRIVEYEQKGKDKAAYGTALLKEISKKLTLDFGKGFTETNLKYFRQFYLNFPAQQIGHSLRDQSSNAGTAISHAVSDELNNTSFKKKTSNQKSYAESSLLSGEQTSYALRRELTWTHYRLLLRVENKKAREYYIQEAIEENWSTRALERQINSLYYERILSSKNNKAVKEEAEKSAAALPLSATDLIKDPYVLEFLNLPSGTGFLEKDLEDAIINKLQHFLLELGRGFSFVAQQKRISAQDEHFYIDLVFYNYILKCFVLIDLKLGKLMHQDIGQMDLYVRWFEENMKTPTDSPTIGIILCSEKNETIVKYSVLKGSKQLFASKYKLYLPTEEELVKEIQEELMQYKLEHTK